MSKLSDRGREINDPTPIRLGLDLQPEKSIDHKIRDILTQSLSMMAENQGHESFEEANDFDVESEFDAPIYETHYQKMQNEHLEPDFVESEESPPSDSEKPERPARTEKLLSEIKNLRQMVSDLEKKIPQSDRVRQDNPEPDQYAT